MRIVHLIFALVALAVLFFIGSAVSTFPVKVTIVVITGLVFSFLTIRNLETGLYLLIFVVPFTQQLAIGRVGAPIDIGTDDVLILFIILSWLAVLARSKEPIFLKTSLNWPIVAFFAVSVFSFIGAGMGFGTSAVLICSLHLFKFFEYVLIYFIVVSAINNIEQVKKFILMFFIVAGFIAVVHFSAMIKWGYFSITAPPPMSDEIYLYLQTMHAFESNAILGIYYCFFLSILIAILLNMPPSKNKIPLLLFAAVLSFGLFNSYSRSAYLALFVSFFILAMLKEKRLFLIMLLLVIFSPIYMQTAVLERITITIQAFTPTIIFDESATIRLVLWKKAFQAFLNNPIIGSGFWLTRWVLRSDAHSQYLSLLIDIGILGFSVFVWLIIRMFKNAIILMKRADDYILKSLAIGYIAGLAGILTTCFFSETLEAFRMVGPLWFVTGLVTSANRLLSQQKEGASPDRIEEEY